jgi:hypothetical protein
MRRQGTLVRIYDCGRSARSGQRSHPPTPRRPDHRASKPTCNPGSLDRLGVFFWCGSGREGVLLVLLASAQQFPTPREGWKGVPRSDRSHLQALLPARLEGRDILVAISGLTYVCIVLQMARYTASKERRARRWRKAEGSPRREVETNNRPFGIGPLHPISPPMHCDQTIRHPRCSAVERLRQMQEARLQSQMRRIT